MGLKIVLLFLLTLSILAEGNPSVDWMLEDSTFALERHFSGKILMFTTPWNKHGDELVEKYVTKVDYYCPCIFNIVLKGSKAVI